MNNFQLTFLRLLEIEMSRTLISGAGDDASRQVAGLAVQELQRIQLDETVVPQLRAVAAIAYRALLPKLRAHLDASICAALEKALDAATPDSQVLDAALGAAAAALQARNDDLSNRLAGQLVAIDARVRAGKEQAWTEHKSKPLPDAAAGGLGDLTEEQKKRLLDFLKAQFPKETSLQLASVRPLNGGFSKQTLFVDLVGNIELPARLVMRRDAPYETHGTSVTMEFPILQKVHAAGVSVPKPYALDADGKVLGTPFIILSLVHGRILGDFLVVHEPSRALGLNMAKQVAELHKVPIDELADLLSGGNMPVRDRVLGEIQKHEAMWRKVVYEKNYVVQAALDWLKHNVALADGPRALIHRDIGLHNLLVHDDHIAAFLDWETVVVGTPAEDVAYTYYPIVQMMDWNDYLAAYEQSAGVGFDKRQLDFYMLWASLRILIGLRNMVDPIYSGERPSLVHFHIGDYFAQTLMNRISAKLAEILAA